MKGYRKTLFLLAGLALAACGEEAISTPEVLDAPMGAAPQEGFICEVIDFNEFDHADQITSVSAFGLNFPVVVAPWGPTSQSALYAYDTDNVGGPDFDLEWNGVGARCADCEGLGRIAVIGHTAGIPVEGDSQYGGIIAFYTGASGAEFYVESFKAIDDESPEPVMKLYVDGVPIAQSTQQGDGSVETISTLGQTFFHSFAMTVSLPNVEGSGGVDDIVLCKRQPPPPPGGGQGCTPGYWKQTQHFDNWTAPYTPSTQFSAVFANAFPGKTLLEVVSLGGGGLNALGRHTVAALLNAASSDVDYDMTVAEIIAQFNAAYASGSYEPLKNIFEQFNEQGCSLS